LFFAALPICPVWFSSAAFLVKNLAWRVITGNFLLISVNKSSFLPDDCQFSFTREKNRGLLLLFNGTRK